jgi:hypothetical protein
MSCVCRAIVVSSSVGITWTSTRLPGALIRPAPPVFGVSVQLHAQQRSRSHVMARASTACSPIPPVKTKPSSPALVHNLEAAGFGDWAAERIGPLLRSLDD